jgi:hypothetical protein
MENKRLKRQSPGHISVERNDALFLRVEQSVLDLDAVKLFDHGAG